MVEIGTATTGTGLPVSFGESGISHGFAARSDLDDTC